MLPDAMYHITYYAKGGHGRDAGIGESFVLAVKFARKYAARGCTRVVVWRGRKAVYRA